MGCEDRLATARARRGQGGPSTHSPRIPARFGVRAATLEIGAGEELAAQARDAGVVLPGSLATAGATRRKEYLAGRVCARLALEKLLGPVAAAAAGLGTDADGVPQWPVGVVGSISHGAGMGFAAVAAASRCGCLGVDVERVVSPERAARLSRRVLGEPERRLAKDWPRSEAEWFTLVFSAKEGAYKALFPLLRRFLGFADIALVDRCPADGQGESGCLRIEVESVAGQSAPYRTLCGFYTFTGRAGDTPRVWTLVVGAAAGRSPAD